MNLPDKCPNCGALEAHRDSGRILFKCGSRLYGDGSLVRCEACEFQVELRTRRADKERLDWLEKELHTLLHHDDGTGVVGSVLVRMIKSAPTAREAIDKARGGGGECRKETE